LDYLEAGAAEGWMIHPRKRQIQVYRRDAEDAATYSGDMLIDTSLLFPGLSLPAEDIFKATLLPDAD
jgi:Uma2 family endonuclease